MTDNNSPLSSQLKKVPITILTGFLGAGKTTLLNYILNQNHGKRIVVVQNEFGEAIGLETAMIVGDDGSKVQEWLEFPNGCICCTVKDDMVKSLEMLVDRKDKFDYLIIETTGMADPGPLAQSLWLDDALESSLYLDGIITLVDAKHFEKQLNERKSGHVNEAQRQVAFADLIVLNKCDLVNEQELESLEKRVLEVNSLCPRIKTTFSNVPLESILNINAFSIDKATHLDASLAVPHKHVHKSHKSEDDIHTVAFEVPTPTTPEHLNQWLAHWVWERADECTIFRMKGFAAIQGDTHKHIIQGVYDNFEVKRTHIQWGEEEQRTCKFVLIGKKLNKKALQGSFCS
uniref:CobW C-terminal domain-containing protein n=1 Tax=Arcella intermedia TaxID=1963864 RepID=A0A6B2L8X8_9EUKA